jgi:hypothetical protein
MKLKHQIRIAIILGFLSLVAGILGHLALTDIYHAEADLTLEWNMLRVFAVIFLIFIGYTLFTLRRILKII